MMSLKVPRAGSRELASPRPTAFGMFHDGLVNSRIGTAPAILQIFWTPFLSIKSDRHRGPRGRRVPFLLYAAPPVCLCLAVLAFGNEIGAWIQSTFLQGASLATVTIWVFGILAFLYTVFNTYLGTAFYYLFNDVVPEEHFVKFMAWMRASRRCATLRSRQPCDQTRRTGRRTRVYRQPCPAWCSARRRARSVVEPA